jgi:hypothetical protein
VPHKGSYSGCGGNPDGISSSGGAGNCGGSCDNCGAGTHWTCCGDTRQSSTHCLPHITEQQAMLNKEAMFSPHGAIRNRDISGVWYGGAHNQATNTCMICTSCGVCTGYGAGCCECTGKDRSGDKGKECGCGAGKSGCSHCGQCEKCATGVCGGKVSTASMAAAVLPAKPAAPAPAAVTAHNHVSNKCMICTSCGVCTGFGAGCVRCKGKDRSGDKGEECGCGGGKSGCSNCGQCEKCATGVCEGKVSTASMATATVNATGAPLAAAVATAIPSGDKGIADSIEKALRKGKKKWGRSKIMIVGKFVIFLFGLLFVC